MTQRTPRNGRNPNAMQRPQRDPPAPPEVQNLFIQAAFWRQKYFELLQHSNQVIAMLAQPPAVPSQPSGGQWTSQPPGVPSNDPQETAQAEESAPSTTGD